MELWTLWWGWLVVAAVLAMLEIVLPGFVLLGFAIGAACVGALMGLNILGGSLAWAVLVFAVASLVAWLVLRRAVGVRQGQVRIIDRDINEN